MLPFESCFATPLLLHFRRGFARKQPGYCSQLEKDVTYYVLNEHFFKKLKKKYLLRYGLGKKDTGQGNKSTAGQF